MVLFLSAFDKDYNGISEDEVVNYYNAHKEEFIRKEQRRFYHILFEKSPSGEDRQAVKKKAEELIRALELKRSKTEDGAASIFEVTEEFLKGEKTGKRWGDTGWVSQGHFPEALDRAIFSLKNIGDFTLVETELGFHIVQLMHIREPRVYSFVEVKRIIKNRLAEQKRGDNKNKSLSYENDDEGKERFRNMVFIPGGMFRKGPTEDEIKLRLNLYYKYVAPHFNGKSPWWLKIARGLRKKVKVKSFYIDKFEVTVGEYEEFIRSTGASPLPNWVIKYAPGDDYPVVGVNWFEAKAFCEWEGKRLPTEEECELAARGKNGRTFPWGNELPDGMRANFCDYNSKNAWRASEIDDGFQYAAPIGSYPEGATPDGIYDLAGNVREWTSSEYDDTNKAVVKGGSFDNAIEDCMSYDHRVNDKNLRSPYIGFRCVKAISTHMQKN